MDIIFWAALLFMLVGIVGSVLPVVPGPVLSFAGLAVYYIFQKEESLTLGPFLLFALGMLLLLIADYFLPLLGAKFSGASKQGQWGAVVGALVGIAFFPPLGIFVGAVIGAVIGEVHHGKRLPEAMRAAAGIIAGSVVATFVQILFSLSVLAYFLIKVV